MGFKEIRWDFGDDTNATDPNKTTGHVYYEPGTYYMQATVVYSDDTVMTRTVTIVAS